MGRKRKNYKSLDMTGLIILLFGVACIWYVLNQPCEVDPITQEVAGVTVATTSQPEQMDRLLCLSTDPIQVIGMLLGGVAVWAGGSRFFEKL